MGSSWDSKYAVKMFAGENGSSTSRKCRRCSPEQYQCILPSADDEPDDELDDLDLDLDDELDLDLDLDLDRDDEDDDEDDDEESTDILWWYLERPSINFLSIACIQRGKIFSMHSFTMSIVILLHHICEPTRLYSLE